MPDYRLSGAAAEDLKGIAQYGDEHFGVAQSNRYRDRLKQRFSALAAHPMHSPAVEHIHTGYRRSVCGAHAIYYRIDPGEIVIVRILRSQNPRAALEK